MASSTPIFSREGSSGRDDLPVEQPQAPPGAIDDALKQADVAITEKDAVKLAEIPERVIVARTEVALPEDLIARLVAVASVSR